MKCVIIFFACCHFVNRQKKRHHNTTGAHFEIKYYIQINAQINSATLTEYIINILYKMVIIQIAK